MSAPMIRVTSIVIFFAFSSSARVIKEEDLPHYKKRVTEMFHHAYDGYIRYAYPYDELRPLTCDGHDTWGSYSLTLIDALDMLIIMGNKTEFQRVANLVIEKMDFEQDINVSVFETNIRVVGGLLSAHLFSKRGGLELEPGWPCSGPLLRMAEDVARKLIPAFDTPTGMPYGTVNLLYGVPSGETTVTCTAGVGTFIVEFGALSKLTGDPIFEKVAMRAMKSLFQARSTIGLVGNHVDVATGKWTALDAGIGGGVDSYFEYLVKGSIMFQNTELLDEFNEYSVSVEKYLKRDDWYMWAHMTKGTISLPVFTSLDCYWPGIQAMLGNIDSAMKTIHNFHQVWKQFGFIPEYYNIVKNEANAGREGYPLRPELVEAAMYLYQATRDPYLLEIGVDMLESIEHNTKTKCGYATVKDVNTHTLENRMESFFLAETVKYLYLLFDPDNFIHNIGDHGTVIHTSGGQCIIDTGSYIFNTEAHPIDTAALYCCSAEKKEDDLELQNFFDNLDLLTLFDINDNKDVVKGVRWSKGRQKLVDFEETANLGNLNLFFDNTGSEHQKLLSTKGEKFTVKSPKDKVTVMTLEEGKVKVRTENIQKPVIDVTGKDHTTDGAGRSDQKTAADKESAKSCSAEDEACNTAEEEDSSKTFTEEENVHPESSVNQQDKDLLAEKTESEDQQVIDEITESGAEDSKEELESDSGDKEDIVESDTGGSEADVAPTTSWLTSSKHISKTNTGTENIKDVLNLIKKFTENYLSNNGLKSVKSLHDKLQYYSLFHRQKHDQLTCEAQPFHMRFSLMGEMFLTDLS